MVLQRVLQIQVGAEHVDFLFIAEIDDAAVVQSRLLEGIAAANAGKAKQGCQLSRGSRCCIHHRYRIAAILDHLDLAQHAEAIVGFPQQLGAP